MKTDDRFFAKVHMTSECWTWTAGRYPNGYGQFFASGKKRHALAHRFAYEQMEGPIPEGLELDHLCRNRACVRPDHLEPVTRKENLLRGTSWQGSKTHCPKGHEYTEANTYRNTHANGNPYRRCRACMKEYGKK